MSDYRLRFHLLRLPQLDQFDGANRRETLGFALGVDADFDPSVFTDASDGYGDHLLQRVRERLVNRLPGAGAADYERELAAELGLLMPWTWSSVVLTLRQGARTFVAAGLDPGTASANDRLGLYRYIDRREAADDDWSRTIYSAAAAKDNWSLPGDPGNELAEIELAADGFASWPALLATLGQETAPVGVRYFRLYRLFRLAATAVADGEELHCEKIEFEAQSVDCRFDFAGEPTVEIQIDLGGERPRLSALYQPLDTRLDPGWEQSGGWLATTARQGPGLDVLPGRLLPWFDRAAWLLQQEPAGDAAAIVHELDARLGFGARFDGNTLQRALDDGNLVRMAVDEAAGIEALEKAAQAWAASGDSARLRLLVADAGEELTASWNTLAAETDPLKVLVELSPAERLDRLRELQAALLRPASLQRRFRRLWSGIIAADHAAWLRLTELDLARRVELDAGSAGVRRVLDTAGALGSRGALAAALVAAIGHTLALGADQAQAWADSALKEVWPEENAAALPAHASDAEGLALQILSGQNEAALADLAGVGLLLQRESPAPSGWRCPLLGQGVGGAGRDATADALWQPALAVLPFQRMQGFLRTDAIYRGETLVQFDDPLAAQIDKDSGLKPALEGMYRVRWPQVADVPPLMQAPTLAYGGRYRFAAFGVPNPGVLPRELQRVDDPLTLRDELPAGQLASVPQSPSLAFLRTRAVQALEFVDAASGQACEPARSGLRYGREAPLRAFEITLPDSVAPIAVAPLLLLPALREEARLIVRPPRCDCQTFLRWCEYDRLTVAGGSELRGRWDRFVDAAEALAWYLEDQRSDESRAALLPVDPAVTALGFRLLDEAGTPLSEPVRIDLREVLPANVDAGYTYLDLLKDDRLAATLVLRKGAAAALRLDGGGRAVVAELPEESINFVHMYPITATADQARFAASTNAARWPGVVLPVEIGTQHQPLTESELFDAVSVSGVGADARDIELRLLPASDAALRRKLRRVQRIEVGTQVWRWQGRPFPPPPRSAIAPGVDMTAAADLRWEADTFADRSEQPGQLVATRLLDGGARDGGFVLLHREAAGGDARERWFRFRVSAIQRYAGLYRMLGKPLPETQERVTAARPREIPKPKGATFPLIDRWLRARRAAATPVELPVPRIKAFVPLTLSAGAGGAAAGVLCLLNESFCEIGGLTEGLEAVVEQVALQRPGQELVLQEYGHDPLFSGAERQNETLRTLAVTGPLGHTFDTDTRAPLFVASSFVLDPPAQTRAFDFFKLKLRRVLDPAGFADAPAAPATLDAADVAARGEYVAELAAADAAANAALRLGSGAAAVRCGLQRSGDHWDFVLPPPWRSVLRSPGVAAAGELRLCLKRLREIRRDGVLRGSEWELAVAARARPEQAWRRVAVALYAHESDSSPLGFALALEQCSVARVASGPRLSAYTPSTWVQCLPDRAALLPPGFADCSIERDSEGKVRLRAGATALTLQSRPLATPGDDANPPRGVAELLLVTRLVRGLDGREFESYLGVYASEGKDWTLLEGDGIGAGDTFLQGRVLWVQVVPSLFGQAFARNALWTLCFPPVAAGSEPVDAQARIVGLSQRFAIHQPQPVTA